MAKKQLTESDVIQSEKESVDSNISDLEIDLDFEDQIGDNDFSRDIEEFEQTPYPDYPQPQEESLQRTEQWQEDRKECFTGSKGKTIMSCSQRGARMDWNDEAKLFQWGKGVEKYIFEKAMERKTGRYIKTASTSEMKYGTAVEPLIEKRIIDSGLLPKDAVLQSVGFKNFPNNKKAGASADSIFTIHDEIKGVVENKACTSWGTYYDRTYEATNEDSIDFWQMIMEMIAWEVEECYYFVISPPADIMKYVYYDGDIMDLYNEWHAETEINLQVVKKSELHSNILLKRIDIFEQVTNDFLEGKGTIKELLDSYKYETPPASLIEESDSKLEEVISAEENLPEIIGVEETPIRVLPIYKTETPIIEQETPTKKQKENLIINEEDLNDLPF